jgi:hypothetical protein
MAKCQHEKADEKQRRGKASMREMTTALHL